MAAIITSLQYPALADETNAAKRNVEDEQRVYSNANAIPHHSRAAHDAHTRCQRPSHQYQVDGYPYDHGDADRAENRSNDEWEERVADDGDRLEESATKISSKSYKMQ
jgi:hypothetical protein